MNRLFLTMILFGFVQLSFAQIHFKDSAEAYNYWAKRGVIVATYAYMQDYIITVGEGSAEAEIIGKDEYFKQFLKDIDSKDSLPEFAQVSDFLKDNSWGGTEKKLFNPLKKNFESKVSLNESFFRCTKPGSNDLVTLIPGRNNKNDYWNNKTSEIITKYNNSLSVLRKEEQQAVESKTEPIDEKEKTPKTEQQSKGKSQRNPKQTTGTTILLYGGILIIGFLFGGGLVYFITKLKIYSILGVEKRYYLNKYFDSNARFIFRYLGVVYVLKQQKDLYKRDSESKSNNGGTETLKLKNEIAQLEKEKKELHDENIQLGKKVDNIKVNGLQDKANDNKIPTTSDAKTNQKPLQKIYFSMPENNGSFQIVNGEPSNDGKKYFRIEFEEASNYGELFFLSGERDQRAINRLESYLKPVCDIENISNSATSKKIELKQSGKVSLINDSWVIDSENKIKIKLY